MTPNDLADRPARRKPTSRSTQSRTNTPTTRRKAAPRTRARRPQTQTTQRRGKTGNPQRSEIGRRLLAFAVIMCLGFGAIVVKLINVQGLDASKYAAFGESQRVRTVVLAADRGSIFDRNGYDLALTVPTKSIWVNPKLMKDPLATARALSPVLDMDETALLDKFSRKSSFVYLSRQVNDSVAKKVAALRQPGVFALDEPKRIQPADSLGASILGRVGVDNEGLSGLEAQYEKQLAGQPGQMVVERDPSGKEIPGGLRKSSPTVRGEDLVLTIDRSLQHETERALSEAIVANNAKGGITLVMDTRSGEILAMANMTTPRKGGEPVSSNNNMALTNVYEPGSVNKLITISGALEDKVIKANSRLTVPNAIQVADHKFTEHDPHPTLSWSITDIMANSSNVGTIMIGKQLGKDRLDSYMRDFGFGQKTGLGFPGESRGIMLDPKSWTGTSIGTIPIGQGISVTAVQMLAAYNAIANDGVYIEPKLVKATIDGEGNRVEAAPGTRRRVVSAATARQVTSMLSEVVRAGTGTKAAINGYTVAGKTGTAGKPNEGKLGYKKGAYVSSFAGFVPAERPALTSITMLDEPEQIFGGVAAAPVFARVAQYALREFRISPPPQVKGSAAPEVSESAIANVREAKAARSTPTPTTSTPVNKTMNAPTSGSGVSTRPKAP